MALKKHDSNKPKDKGTAISIRLTTDQFKMLERLQKHLNFPSRNALVEALIEQEYKAQFKPDK